MRLTTSHCKNRGVQKRHTGPRNRTDNLDRPWQRKMDMRLGTWNVRSLYRAGALGLVTTKLDRCGMDLVGVQEVRWESSGTLESGNYNNGIRLVNFATSKNLIVKSTKVLHRNIHKYTWTSPDGITHNQIDHVLVDKRRQSSIRTRSLNELYHRGFVPASQNTKLNSSDFHVP